jgi:putative CocE/NonD family hydrolase
MIPMRDGVSLETAIFTPNDAAKPLPILLTRTPYGIPADDRAVMSEWYRPLRADGYIFVFQNLRGRFQSEGTFVMDRPPRSDAKAIDETTDAYDTIEWLLHHVRGNSGRVGMIGGSYSAWTATMALLEPHPALKVVSEAASPADQFMGDDFHHNGAFRLSYAFEYCAFLEWSKERNTIFAFDRPDTYDWYLALGPLSVVNDRYFHGRLPTWNDFVHHPNRDEFWLQRSLPAHLLRSRAASRRPASAHVPTLNIAGFWDEEDFYGPLKIYESLEPTDTEHLNHLVIGPWNHDGWSGPGRKLADLDFGSDTGVYYRERIQAVWLAHWLHDKPAPPPPEARVFVTGKNEWRDFDRWPPTDHVTPTKLYLRAGRKLAFESPTESGPSALDEYVSDPVNPVPYVRRPIRPIFQDSDWSIWQALDQRFVAGRPDVLSFETDTLERDITIAGDIVAELFASTSGSDSDWIVKLIDVYPERDAAADFGGYQLMIAGEIMRGRFRTSFAQPEPLTPGKITEYEFSLRSHAHVFLKGHKIMIQIQSTWFPLIDRNPQKFVPNIFAATSADYVRATQRIARSRAAPSAIVLPVLSP